MATAEKDPETIIREFLASWPERSVDRFLDFFTDDAIYHNMPLEPVSGKNGIREVLNLFLPADEIEAEIVHLAAHGNRVFTERVDRFRFGYVVDFLDFYVRDHHWPAFNIADSAICIGICLLFLDMKKHPEEKEVVTAETT